MPLDVTVIKRPPTGAQFWDAMLRVVPRALAGTAARMAAAAPRGRTRKLGRRVIVRVKPMSLGLFAQGVQADFGVGVHYGHLVTGGHQIIARGRGRGSRGAVIGSRAVTRTTTLVGSGAQASFPVAVPIRSTRLAELKTRRAAGSIGRVPGNPFADIVFAQERGAIVATIERTLAQDVGQ
jgi:hypothetical protein